MNKDKKIERLEQKLTKAQERIKALESEVRKAKSQKSKSSKKKDVRTAGLSSKHPIAFWGE